MAWTEFTRKRYERSGGRYASDATDAGWALIASLLPAPRRVGRPRTTDLRDVFDAILYIATTGCQWRMLPNDFPPVSTVLNLEEPPGESVACPSFAAIFFQCTRYLHDSVTSVKCVSSAKVGCELGDRAPLADVAAHS